MIHKRHFLFDLFELYSKFSYVTIDFEKKVDRLHVVFSNGGQTLLYVVLSNGGQTP